MASKTEVGQLRGMLEVAVNELSRARREAELAQGRRDQLADELAAAEREAARADLIRRTAEAPFVIVDHYDSDRSSHLYCRACREQIPPFLVRSEQPGPAGPAHEDWDECEGCGKPRQP